MGMAYYFNLLCFQAFFLLIFGISFSKAQYEDVRCKCVCPKESSNNVTKRNVFVEAVQPDECTCQHLVKREESFCLRCQCQYEARNTTLIKVVIIFIIVVIGILCIYLVYLSIDAKRKPLELSVTADEVQQNLRQRRRQRPLSMLAFDEKVSRWKRTVAEQRRNIYDTRTMLS